MSLSVSVLSWKLSSMWCPFDSIELAPPSWLGNHHILLRSGWHRDVVQIENLTPDLPAMSIQEREVLYRLTYFPECGIALYGWGVSALPLVMWGFRVWNTLLDVSHLFLRIAFLGLYVEFLSGDHFCQRECRLLSDGLVEVSCIDSILERPHKHLLVWWEEPDGSLIKAGEIVLQWLWWTLGYVKQNYGRYLPVVTGSKLMYPWKCQIVIFTSGSHALLW